MTFEKDYNKLLNYASQTISNRRLRCEPEDLVNEAYIEFCGFSTEYNYDLVKKLIVALAYTELDYQRANVSGNFKEEKVTSCTCKKCGDTKPVSGFYLRNYKSIITIFSLCKTCYNRKISDHYYCNKEKHLERSRIWKQKNAERIRLKKKQYWLKTKTTSRSINLINYPADCITAKQKHNYRQNIYNQRKRDLKKAA